MQFTTTVVAFLAAAGSSFAAPAPAPAEAKSMMAAASTWTIQSFKRTCNSANTSCNYNFGINLNNGSPATACAYTITGNPASHAAYNSIKCGNFAVGGTWSGQFGPGKGFQTLSVVLGNQIIYPGYTDAQLVNGKTVTPDQSYTPQNLP